MAEYIKKSKVERMLWAVIMSKDERTIKEMLEDAPIVNAIPVSDNATNGDMIKAMFPNYTIQINSICESVSVYYEGTEEHQGSWFRFDLNWWNAPYKKGTEEDD